MDTSRNTVTSFRDSIRVLQRRKWLILQALLILPIGAVLLSLRQEPLYEASAAVVIRYESLASVVSGIDDPALYQDPIRSLATQTQLAQTIALARRVLRAAGLRDRKPEDLLRRLQVVPEPNADLLQFRVTDGDPAVAMRLATAYGREFPKYRHGLNTASLRGALRDVEARISELQASTARRSPQYERSLIDKAEQLRTFEALEGSNAFLLRAATGAVKIQPRPLRSAALGLVLGAFLGLGLALLWEVLDTRVRSAEEIGERLHMPLLARIPEPPRQLVRQNQLVMMAAPSSPEAEAFRMLRTNLEFVNIEREARTIMITSAVEREGKSTTIANLAVALARAGRRVVLVDLDLRRPFVDKFFGLEGRPGLTDVALGHVPLEEAMARIPIVESGRNGSTNGHASGGIEGLLEVLPSGPIPPDAGEFVGTRKVTNLLNWVGMRADIVLIDAPPLLHVGDAMALAARVDALLLVTRLSVIRTTMLAEVRRLLESCPASKLGFILTGAEAGADYGQGGYYYSTTQKPRERDLVG